MIYRQLGFDNKTEVQRRISGVKKNVLILSSCGSGKTEASYFNMLENKSNKVILIEPMQTLATGLRSRLQEYNSKLGLENVTLQHSSNIEDKFLDNKYCVTTIDQVLSGYLALGEQSFIRGKNVLLSDLIFDEVQLFNTENMLLTTINMLDEINKLGHRFIIMTATMPSYLIELLKNRYDMEVIITDEQRKDRNVKLYYIDELDINKIKQYHDKQIIIFNTVKQLLEVAKELDKDRTIILHSKYQLTDRKKIENEVYKYFGKHSTSNNKILLTTQIVEVGVDISANRLYTTLCPIDNLIQRDGRCCRWGGDGNVIVFSNDDKIYDTDVLTRTKSLIINNQGISFNWDIQKQWIDEVLNTYYKDRVSDILIKKNKLMFKKGGSFDLIRNIQTVNLVISNSENITRDDFNKESVSVYINELKYIANTNKLYTLHKKDVIEASVNAVNFGDTIVVQGNNCIYDKFGFRYVDDAMIFNNNINFYSKDSNNIKFDDYIEEPWICHADLTQRIFKDQLLQDSFNEYVNNNIDELSFYAGLHDLGKLDVEWQRKNNSEEALAHFPFTCKQTKPRTHGLISGLLLEEYIDNIAFNMIIQHHGRININDMVVCSEWELHKDTYKYLHTYGFNNKINTKNYSTKIDKNNIILPNNKNWSVLLYLVGTLMQCEICAIEYYKNNPNYRVYIDSKRKQLN